MPPGGDSEDAAGGEAAVVGVMTFGAAFAAVGTSGAAGGCSVLFVGSIFLLLALA
jgi:hypothetical protein